MPDDAHTLCRKYENDDPMGFSFETKVCAGTSDNAYLAAMDGSKSKLAIFITLMNSAATMGYRYG